MLRQKGRRKKKEERTGRVQTKGPIVFTIDALEDDIPSPSLSDIEEADIGEAIREFAMPDTQVFETPKDLLRDLHEARERYRAKHRAPVE